MPFPPLEFQIEGRHVGDGHPCYIIAEIGSNHNNNFDLACKLIDAAADSGVDAVKFQTFDADKHYSKYTPNFDYLNGQDTHSLIKSLELERSWHQPLMRHAASQGLTFFSSPCDYEAVDELGALNVAAFKVASFDLTDIKLIERIAKYDKPVILSAGMADWTDIQNAVNVCRKMKNNQILLLQCTSLYPAPPLLSNLAAMDTMRRATGCLTGYSDHTEGVHIALASVSLGACVIEKHFTLDRTMSGPDHAFASEPHEFKAMVTHLRDIEAAIGDGIKNGPRDAEKDMFEKGRRSLHAAFDIPSGTIITEEMLIAKRPGFGIRPFLMEHVIGRAASVDIAADKWITWEML